MTDQERQDAVNVWAVRQQCLQHAMSVAANTANADTVVAYATVLETYVMRDVVVSKVTEPQS
jgi:hypothetical protein